MNFRSFLRAFRPFTKSHLASRRDQKRDRRLSVPVFELNALEQRVLLSTNTWFNYHWLGASNSNITWSGSFTDKTVYTGTVGTEFITGPSPSITITNIPEHEALGITFDFFVMDKADHEPGSAYANGTKLVDSTFSNTWFDTSIPPGATHGQYQNYPGGGQEYAGTGAQMGYVYDGNTNDWSGTGHDPAGDSLYVMSYLCASRSSTLTLSFGLGGMPDGNGEGYVAVGDVQIINAFLPVTCSIGGVNPSDGVIYLDPALTSNGFGGALNGGVGWGNGNQALSGGAAGNNTLPDSVSNLVDLGPNMSSPTTVGVVDNSANMNGFDYNSSTSTWAERYGGTDQFYYDSTNQQYVYTTSDGTETTFYDFNQGSLAGKVKNVIPAGGNTSTNLTSYIYDSPPAPSLSQGGGGTLGSTTYYVQTTYVNASGQSLASTEMSKTVSANNLLKVNAPPAIPGATGYNVYASTSSGGEVLQNGGTPVSLNSPWNENSSGLTTGTASPPATGTGNLLEILRTDTTGTVTTKEGFVYTYLGGSDPNAGKIGEVELERKSYDTGKGQSDSNTPYTPVQFQAYTYYGSGSSNGNLGDLEMVQMGDGGPAQPAVALAAGGSLAPNTTYYYEVTAITAGGEGNPSSEVIAVTTSSNLTVNLTWPPVPNATAYNVYRATSSGAEVLLAQVGNTTSYSDNGSATPGTATPPKAIVDTYYYRYYVPGDSNGYVGALKYVVGPQSYSRLAASLPSGTTPLTATATQVAAYADDYYQYNSNGQVSQAVVQGAGCSACSGGFGTFGYTYTTNPNGASGYNYWASKTTEALPDGSTQYLYYNSYGEELLSITQDATSGKMYGTYTEYDGSGRPILVASPSAVVLPASLSTLEQYPDLLNNQGAYGTNPDFQYLSPHSGLITITDYYSASDSPAATSTTPGAAIGYVKDTQVEQGEFGAPVMQQKDDYYAVNNVIGPSTVFPIGDDTVYGTAGGDPRVTSFQYTWFSGTNQMQSETIIQPVVSATQNGPGTVSGTVTSTSSSTVLTDTSLGNTYPSNYFVGWEVTDFIPNTTLTYTGTVTSYNAATDTVTFTPFQNGGFPATNDHYTLTPGASVQVFDQYGRVIWSKDADGYINYAAYDMGTGAAIKTITDVNTNDTSDFANLPTGWITRPGGGQELITSTQVDEQGRPVMSVDPDGNVTYTVYNDTYATNANADLQGIRDEVRVYPGWTGTVTTGPIQISREYRPLPNAAAGQQTLYDETLTSSATPHLTNGVPDGSESLASSNVQTVSRSLTNGAGQVIESDAYFSLGGTTFSSATAKLGSSSNNSSSGNYSATVYGYDAAGRQNRVQEPTGTIRRTVYNGLGDVISRWVGTNDTPASGYWSPTNNTSPSNMVDIEDDSYDQTHDFAAAPAAPTLSQSSGTVGAIPATTYYVMLTYLGTAGETLPSTESTITVAAGHVLTVTSPAAEAGATQYNVYVSTSSGAETLQNASPISIGTNWTEPSFGITPRIVPPPAPTLTDTTGGSAGADIYYYVKITYVGPGGETWPSSEVQFYEMSASRLLVVDSPPSATGATGYNVYVSSSTLGGQTGLEVLQNTSGPITIGTNWTEPTSGLVTGLPAPVSSSGAGTGPQFSTSASGNLPARTYYIVYTYVNSSGQSLPSVETAASVPAGNVITVDSPPTMSGATGYDVYISETPGPNFTAGSEVLQNSSPIAIGSNWTELNPGVVGVGLPVPSDVGESNLTEVDQHVSATAANDHVTLNLYDWRDRLIATKQGAVMSGTIPNPAGETDGQHRLITFDQLDNAGETIGTYTYAGDGVNLSDFLNWNTGTDASDLRAYTASQLDDQGRIYLSQQFSVDPTSGVISSNSLATNYFYNNRGNRVEESDPGGQVTKSSYDGAGRQVKVSITDGGAISGAAQSWMNAQTTANDVVVEQTITSYDPDGNVILTVDRQRFNTDPDTTTGDLAGPGGGNNASRDYYSASWYDLGGRLVDAVNLGTNASVGYVYPSPAPSHATGTGTTTTLVDTSRTEASGNFVGYQIVIVAGTDAGQRATVTAYNSSTKTLTFSPAFSSATDGTSLYRLLAPAPGKSILGYASAAGSTTTLIDTSRAEPSGYFVGYQMKITAGTDAGQISTVTAYNGSTGTFTLSPALNTPTSSSSVYTLIPGSVTGTATSSGTTSTLVSSALTAPSNMFVGWTVTITSGTDSGKSATVTGFNASTGTLTFSPAFSAATDTSSVFALTLPPLTTHTDYNAAGEIRDTVDPRGIPSGALYDMLGRQTETIAGWDGSSSPTQTSSTNQTTTYTYDGNNDVLTMTAVMPAGSNNQITAYDYGVNTRSDGSIGSGSSINSNDLLAAVLYPDPTNGKAGGVDPGGTPIMSDVTLASYDDQGEKTVFTDQNGTTHGYLYDVLGRLTADIVTTLASGIDSSVLRLGYSFNDAGLPYQQTSYSNTSGTSIVNQIQDNYNGYGQLIAQYESYSGAVNTSSTPYVGYTYSQPAGANYSRLSAMIYPNGRILDYGYGVQEPITGITSSGTTATATYAGANQFSVGDTIQIQGAATSQFDGRFTITGINTSSSTLTFSLGYTGTDSSADITAVDVTSDPLDNAISRVATLEDQAGSSPGNLQSYIYLGLSTIVQQNDGNGVSLTYIHQSGDTLAGSDAGDQYTGLDRFGRVVDQYWTNLSTPGSPTDRFQYGYDRDSNVLYQDNLVDPSESFLYHESSSTPGDDNTAYDPLNRITAWSQGTLSASGNNGNTLDTNSGAGGTYAYTATGAPASTSSQTMTTNSQNQVTSTSYGPGNPQYDNNGNMIVDAGGNDYTYNAWNQIVAAGSGESYQYDALGRRIYENEFSHYIYYDASGQELEDRTTTATATQFVWGVGYVNDLVERDDYYSGSGNLGESGSGLGRRLYAQQDVNWDVVSVVDSSGNVLERVDYSPYAYAAIVVNASYTAPLGTLFTGNGTSFIYWEYGFQGGRAEVGGLFRFGVRDYDTNRQEWVQQDPAGYVEGVNLYGFDDGDPTTRVDPIGLRSSPACAKVGNPIYGPWKYIATVPGNTVDGSQAGAAPVQGTQAYYTAVYRRYYYQLIQCCDACGTGFYKWRPGVQVGYAMANGQPNAGLVTSIQFPLPVPLWGSGEGQAIDLGQYLGWKIVRWVGPAPTYQGRPSAPNVIPTTQPPITTGVFDVDGSMVPLSTTIVCTTPPRRPAPTTPPPFPAFAQ
jgi:RHS repeat-associated protein